MRINYETDFATSPRFKKLVRRLKLPVAQVLGCCMQVWTACYDARTPFQTHDDVDAAADVDGFAQAMVDVELADLASAGDTMTVDVTIKPKGEPEFVVPVVLTAARDGVRVKGLRERIEFLLRQRILSKRGVEAKAAKRHVDADPSVVPSVNPRVNPQSTPLSLDLDLPLVPDRPLRERPESRPPEPAPAPRESADSEIRSRVALSKWGMQELDRIRARVAERFGWTDVLPLHPFDPGRARLEERLAESGAHGERDLKHVLQIAELEAVAKQKVEWLSGKMFELESWRKKLAMRPADAKLASPQRAGDDRGLTRFKVPEAKS